MFPRQGQKNVAFPKYSNSFVSTAANSSSEDERVSNRSHSSDGMMVPVAEIFQQRMPPPPQNYKKVIDTAVSVHAPGDFAMAWNMAASVSGWKREEPDFRRARKGGRQEENRKEITKKGNKKENLANAALTRTAKATPQDHCAESMPLPKWFVAEASDSPLARANPSLSVQEPIPSEDRMTAPRHYLAISLQTQASMQKPILSEDPMSALASLMCSIDIPKPAYGGGFTGQGPITGLSHEPLKISISCSSPLQGMPPSSALNTGIPCKKRVPEWGF